ncbi:MAG: homoserine dehydrogenase [Candidatus Omnitrophica bacterium]|nr:homoserine dehydrogenase [Candidatus Omnitrophota bacterium]MDD5352553.1 homoserine dehydrogenase [Candidatus Omnitrophota bacterium]MDD5550151.1 homoserine dehydrogenase [Candidatus Omnitrophota bacterium]
MKKINIGLIGLGTIGSGVLKILSQKRKSFKKKYDVDFNMAKICDKNPKLRSKLNISPRIFTTKYQDIVNSKDIDVVIELIGGINPAKDIILRSLESGKSVITANKALLAQDLSSMLAVAHKNKSQLRFEASVCGGIPIIKSLTEGLVADRIESVVGIINGTSNYILSEMAEQDCSFFEALSEAKKRGFAERNPSLDIKGFDSAHKLSILAFLAFGKYILQKDIYVKGIEEISPLDIKYAKELGLVIKLLAIAKKSDGDILEVRVHPTLISEEHPLASVNGIFNAVYIKGELVGDLLFFGQGAGQLPTASAVISDLIDIASQKRPIDFSQKGLIKKIKRMDDIRSKYYIRFMVIDKPGVLAKISGILAKRKISIASVTQKERSRAKVVPVIMLTHDVREKDIRLALEAIDKLAMVKKNTVVIHREEL